MMMTLNRDYVLVTNAGLHIGFKKGNPTHVPQRFVQLALNMGAEPVEGSKVEADQIQNDSDKEVLEEARRAQKLREAIDQLIERNHSGDFTAGGRPNMKKLSAIVGFDADRDEVEKVFDEMRQKMAQPAPDV